MNAPEPRLKPLDATARASRPEFDVHLTENVMVLMRDSVRMATDIYRPARDGRPLAHRRPFLLRRTPYNKGRDRGHLGPLPLLRRARLRDGEPGLPRLLGLRPLVGREIGS